MKDPCDKCVVSTVCSEICDEKRNYATLLSNAVMQNRHILVRDPFSHNHKKFKKYLTLQSEHMKTLSKIRQRKSERETDTNV